MRLVILTFIFVCFSFCRQTAGKETSVSLDFTNIDSLPVLSQLFHNSIIKGEHILWSPAYEDIGSFTNILSSDGLCHTTIDTTIIAANTYYVIFRTDQYEQSIKADCHVCCPIVGIASFEKGDKKFKLKNFRKNVFQVGGYGEYGQIAINDLCVPAFKVSTGWTGTGSEIDYEIYFDINDFNRLFYLTTFNSNGGMFEKGAPNYYETVKSITNKTDSSFVIETAETSYDSLGKMSQTKYRDLVKMFNDIGGQDIEMNRLSTTPPSGQYRQAD